MDRLYKALDQYSRRDVYPFHMPGHKRNPMSMPDFFSVGIDITEIEEFDNLHHPTGVLKNAQAAAAQIYGTKECFYSVNGSTAALLTAISASVSRGGHILIARNCHKAVYNGIYIRNLKVSYVYPQEDPELGINGGISPSRVEICLAENPDIEAVLVTSPTYDGIVSDIKEIAKIVHGYNIPLIVDEAHGAHFHFSDYFPVSAADLGADLVIQSLHKTLPSLTQTAILHRCTDRVSRDKIIRFLGIYQSSSPSYVLMAGMDACVDELEKNRERMFSVFTKNLQNTREQLKKCNFIRLFSPEKGKNLEVFDYDRSKLLFSTVNSTLNGKQLHKILREEFHLEMEMESESYVLALTSVADTGEGFLRLCQAIEEIDQRESLKINSGKILRKKDGCLKLKQKMNIAEAMDSETTNCLFEESAGKISAEFIYLYPPGIPILVPGEQITGQFIKNVRRYIEQGLEVQGPMNVTNQTICVVKEQMD